jgi:hypothetical protein
VRPCRCRLRPNITHVIMRFRSGILDNLPLLGLVHLGLCCRHASNGSGCPSGGDSSSGTDHRVGSCVGVSVSSVCESESESQSERERLRASRESEREPPCATRHATAAYRTRNESNESSIGNAQRAQPPVEAHTVTMPAQPCHHLSISHLTPHTALKVEKDTLCHI